VTGAYAAPRRRGPKAHPDRLMIWGSANKELAVTDSRRVRANHQRQQSLGPRCAPHRHDFRVVAPHDHRHRLSAMAHAFNEADPIAGSAGRRGRAVCDRLVPETGTGGSRWLAPCEACRSISTEKREQHVATPRSFRFCKPDPDHNHAFSHVCQHYAGLVNFDPNFGHGTNERAVSRARHGNSDRQPTSTSPDNAVGLLPVSFSDINSGSPLSSCWLSRGRLRWMLGNTWSTDRQLLATDCTEPFVRGPTALANQASVLRI